MNTLKLDDITKVITKGTTPTSLGMKLNEGDVNYVKVESISTNGLLIPDKLQKISQETHEKLKRSQLQEGDILYSIAGTIGRTSIVERDLLPANTNQAIAIIRPDIALVDTQYLNYALRDGTLQQSAGSRMVQSVQSNLSLGELGQLEIPIPSLENQRTIGRTLQVLDEKIRVNQQIASTLEQIAQTIFKSWFVDFDPVHAKFRGELPVGMDTETAALFPDSFEESELGLIPSGWKIESLTELAEYRNGLALQKYPATGSDTDLPVLKIPQLKANSVDGAGFASNEVPEKFVITDGDCIFSWSGALEVRIWCGGLAALNQHLFKVVPLKSPTWNAYFHTLNHLFEFRAIAEGKATTMGHIKRGDLENAKFASCPPNLIKRADELIAPLLSEFVMRGQQNRTLIQLRDSLLPRLISGELEIPAELLEA